MIGEVVTIPHGVNKDFYIKAHRNRVDRAVSKKIELIYVSTISAYKHQDLVVKAITKLVEKGYDLHLSLIGADGGAMKSLIASLDDSKGVDSNVTYVGLNFCYMTLFECLHMMQ